MTDRTDENCLICRSLIICEGGQQYRSHISDTHRTQLVASGTKVNMFAQWINWCDNKEKITV